jgi:hypothetical protein
LRTVHKNWRDVQRRAARAECALCGGELYVGEPFWRLGGRVLCGYCLRHWLGEVRP